MSVSVNDLLKFPGFSESDRAILDINLSSALRENSPSIWKEFYDQAVTYQALGMTQWMCLSSFKAGGPTTSMSRSVSGTNSSAAFKAAPDLKAWEQTLYGQMYARLRLQVLGTGARVVKRGPDNCLPYPT